jgi:hypothetical protein
MWDGGSFDDVGEFGGSDHLSPWNTPPSKPPASMDPLPTSPFNEKYLFPIVPSAEEDGRELSPPPHRLLCAKQLHKLSPQRPVVKRTGKAIVPGIGTGQGRKESCWCIKNEDEFEDDAAEGIEEGEDAPFKPPRVRVRGRKGG